MQDGALEPEVRTWRCQQTKLQGRFATSVFQEGRRGAMQAQDGPKRAPTHVAPWILSVIAVRLGGPFGFALASLALPGLLLGVVLSGLSALISGLGRARESATCVIGGNS